MNCKPRTCRGHADPILSSTWIIEIEETFDSDKCPNKDNVVFVVTMFENEALY